MSGRPICENGDCMIHRGARYKVYEPTNTSQLPTQHIWHACAEAAFLSSVDEEQTLLVASASRRAERRESRLRCRIDDGEALVQRRLAQEEPAQGPGRSSCRLALAGLPPVHKTGDHLTLERVARFACDLDSGTHKDLVRAAI